MIHHLTISDKSRSLDLQPKEKDPTIDLDLDMKGKLFGAYPCLNYLVDHDGRAVNIEAVLGKYLLICCVSLPVGRFSPVRKFCNSAIATSNELLRDRNDFQMIVVPIMPNPTTSSEHGEKLFKSFLRGFPLHCLSIPYSEATARTTISTYMGIGKGRGYSRDMRAMLLDSTGTILLHHHATLCFDLYGSENFPYEEGNLDYYFAQDHALRMRIDPSVQNPSGYKLDHHLVNEPVSLHKDILLCDPSLVLERFDPTSGTPLSVSELNNRYVGLYLIHDQDFLETLHAAHQDWISKKLEMEIVVVCSGLIVNPTPVQRRLTKALELCNVKSWFVFPFDSRVSRRVWRILASKELEDRFVIIPPNNLQRGGELEGRVVVNGFGTKAYPFTRTSIIESRYAALRSFTFSPTSLIKVEGKMHDKCARDDTWLEEYALGLERLHCKLIFIRLGDQTSSYPNDAMNLPWQIMPYTDPNWDSIINQLFEDIRHESPLFIVVDDNGKIVSVNARGRLEKVGATKDLFTDVLKDDILGGIDIVFFDFSEYYI